METPKAHVSRRAGRWGECIGKGRRINKARGAGGGGGVRGPCEPCGRAATWLC